MQVKNQWQHSKGISLKRILYTLILLSFTTELYAGMPSSSGILSRIAAFHINAISFFMVILFVSAFILMKIWNTLQKDFTSLPKLTYRKSTLFILLTGSIFLIVLTMISGAREIMTPKAWEKSGAFYEVR